MTTQRVADGRFGPTDGVSTSHRRQSRMQGQHDSPPPAPAEIGGNRGLAEHQLLCHLAHQTALFMGQAQGISDARSSCLLPSWHGLSRFA